MLRTLSFAISLLKLRERFTILSLGFLQILTGLFDLVGLVLTGFIATISIEGTSTGAVSSKAILILNDFGLAISSWSHLLYFSVGTAVTVFILKTTTNIFLSRAVYANLANFQARVSRDFYLKTMGGPYRWIKSMDYQQTSFILSDGLMYLIIGTLGSLVTGLVELVLLILILTMLTSISPLVTLFAAVFFFILAFLISAILGERVKRYGALYMSESIKSKTVILDSLQLYRELILSKSNALFMDVFSRTRLNSATSYSKLFWLQQIPKYVMELGVILAIAAYLVITWLFSNASYDLPVLAIFIMASTRVIPSILRLQGVQLALKEYLGKSETTIDYLKEVLTFEATNFSYLKEPAKFSSKAPEIKFSGVNYSYEKNSAQVINNFNLVVEPGSTLVLMGESGSGKSTLCELALGLLNPDVGEILVDGIKIDEWKRASNSTIGYLPQDPHYFTGSIRENITLQSVSTSFDDKKVWQVLEISGLDDFVRQLPDQLETKVQEGGIQLSGGQRQRIGIARTLFQEPQLLIIDEGTNALDLKTENAFLQMLKKLEGVSTIIRVAHNIPIGSSLQKVAYIESGSLKAIGSIEYIRKEFPDLIPASS